MTRLAVSRATVRFGGFVALQEVSVEVQTGTVLGVVGESGSGKTTLARAIAGFQTLSSGEVRLDDRVLNTRRTSADRRRIQLMPQDPYSSLNPRMTVRQVLSELVRAGGCRGANVVTRCEELLGLVQLGPDCLDAYPRQFSGGQRQRIALARALAVDPEVLVADEPTSALDATVQSEVVALLQRLRRDLGLTMVFVSHDLGVVNALCDDVLVLRSGRIVEHALRDDLFAHPREEYSRELLAAVPRLPDAAASTGPDAWVGVEAVAAASGVVSRSEADGENRAEEPRE